MVDVARSNERIAAMDDELLVAGAVRAFAERLLPEDDAAAERAVTVAVRCHLSGASVSEARREGRRMAESQSRHPSRARQQPRRALTAVR